MPISAGEQDKGVLDSEGRGVFPSSGVVGLEEVEDAEGDADASAESSSLIESSWLLSECAFLISTTPS